MKRGFLSPEERVELDALYDEAGLDQFGKPRPSDEIKERLASRLEDALQAGRKWAGYVLDDARAEGLGKSWNEWHSRQIKMRVFHDGVIVPARSVRGTRRRNPDTGKVFHQQTLWREMTWEQVRQQLDDSRGRIAAEQVTISIAARLLELALRCPESTGPLDACERLGLDFDNYLSEEWGAA